MSEKRQIFQIPTQEIYLGNSDIEVEVGKLAVLGFINQEFALPDSYSVDGIEAKAWPVLLLNVRDEELSARPEAYRLVPNYAKPDTKWRLHHGWDTLIQFNEGGPQLAAGNHDVYLWPTPRAYDQKKLQLAIGHAMRRPWMFQSAD